MTVSSPPAYRTTDPATSRAGAASVRVRAGSQKAQLLRAYAMAGPHGLTDEEAAYVTRLADHRSCCWWKRCSELRAAGLIADTGNQRRGQAGESRMVCVITTDGHSAVEGRAA